MLLLQREMSPKKGRRVRKSPQTHLQSLSWGIQLLIYKGGGRRGRQEKGGKRRNTFSREGSGQKVCNYRQKWHRNGHRGTRWQKGRTGFRINLTALRRTLDARDSANVRPSRPQPEEPVHLLHTTSPEVQQTWIVWRSACDQTPQYSLQLQATAQFPSVLQSTSSFQVCTNENHAVIISRAKAGDHQNSFLQLPSILGGGGDFQTFRNEVVKLLSGIHSRVEERSRQPQQPQQQTLSRNSSTTSTFVPQTFQQPQQPALAAREYILTIPETQMPARQAIQPAQQIQVAANGQQQPRGQPTCWWPTTQSFKTAYFHTDPIEALQSTVSCLCQQWRKSTQHIRTLKCLWESTVSDELQTDRHTSTIFTTQPAPTHRLSSNHHFAARTSAAARPASASPRSQLTPKSSSRKTALAYNWSFTGPLL